MRHALQFRRDELWALMLEVVRNTMLSHLHGLDNLGFYSHLNPVPGSAVSIVAFSDALRYCLLASSSLYDKGPRWSCGLLFCWMESGLPELASAPISNCLPAELDMRNC